MADVLSEQAQAEISGPRSTKEPGDPLWCWQTISHLQSLWKGMNLELDMYLKTWAEAEEHRIWEKVPYDEPFGTKERMLEQLAIGDDAEARVRVAVQAIPARSNKTNRLVSRIARNRPDIWQRMKQGEFTSVSAAAREAGIELGNRKRTIALSDNVERVADTLKGHYTREQLQRIIEKLAADDEEPQDS